MKAIVTAKFEFDVTDWYEDEKLTLKQKEKQLKEDLSDFSVFMPLAEYNTLKDVNVDVIHKVKCICIDNKLDRKCIAKIHNW